jgi:hypothetical protein
VTIGVDRLETRHPARSRCRLLVRVNPGVTRRARFSRSGVRLTAIGPRHLLERRDLELGPADIAAPEALVIGREQDTAPFDLIERVAQRFFGPDSRPQDTQRGDGGCLVLAGEDVGEQRREGRATLEETSKQPLARDRLEAHGDGQAAHTGWARNGAVRHAEAATTFAIVRCPRMSRAYPETRSTAPRRGNSRRGCSPDRSAARF